MHKCPPYDGLERPHKQRKIQTIALQSCHTFSMQYNKGNCHDLRVQIMCLDPKVDA